MIEQKYIQAAIDYKKNVAERLVLVEGASMATSTPSSCA
jgi:hypothetical protein